MARYIPITGIDNDFHSLLIDTEAPLDVLHDTAAYRINAVTQLLETGSTTGLSCNACRTPEVIATSSAGNCRASPRTCCRFCWAG